MSILQSLAKAVMLSLHQSMPLLYLFAGNGVSLLLRQEQLVWMSCLLFCSKISMSRGRLCVWSDLASDGWSVIVVSFFQGSLLQRWPIQFGSSRRDCSLTRSKCYSCVTINIACLCRYKPSWPFCKASSSVIIFLFRWNNYVLKEICRNMFNNIQHMCPLLSFSTQSRHWHFALGAFKVHFTSCFPIRY